MFRASAHAFDQTLYGVVYHENSAAFLRNPRQFLNCSFYICGVMTCCRHYNNVEAFRDVRKVVHICYSFFWPHEVGIGLFIIENDICTETAGSEFDEGL